MNFNTENTKLTNLSSRALARTTGETTGNFFSKKRSENFAGFFLENVPSFFPEFSVNKVWG